ncbi:MAG: tRNA (adenosine(37)-N6)-threonylcarbamoyltransferase complex ATPase subunit type 1 TsaE [Rickettsiales bacterium]|jgi:tRNA A37 threonylcarbamoyladenosine biosynthesis protein TsaE|nr:tRNA (adenosine(37)-N6)-threonylcarbamoyltransferase complex ATPase subunit type 1 TsaE [Rickettsiales bacterium]
MFFDNAESLRKYAAGFAEKLRTPASVALHGDLGAGKTEFARAAIRALCGENTIVPSPTFTLVQEYTRDSGFAIRDSRFVGVDSLDRIFHFDLYRIKNAGELEEIGFFDALADGIVFVEWPEIAADFLPKNTVHVYLSVSGAGREVSVSGRDSQFGIRDSWGRR